MTKELYPAPGRIEVICLVTSIKNNRKLTSKEIGGASMYNVARDYIEKVENAKLNAIYLHMQKGGSSDAIAKVIDFDITYFTKKTKGSKQYAPNLVIVKKKQYTRNGVAKNYSFAINPITGKRIYRARIVTKGDLNTFQ
jgi:hypothetical protein